MKDDPANNENRTDLTESEAQPAGTEKEAVASTPEIELRAFNQMVTALSALPKEAWPRVMRSVLTFFGFVEDTLFPVSQSQRGSLAVPGISAAGQSSFSEDRTPSPKEFIVEKKPLTDIERIACLAYYLTHYRNTPHFKTLDLSKLNTEAAQVKFSNASVAVDNAAAAGLLVAVGKGNKQISANAEIYVQALPDREAAKAAIAHARPRRKFKRAAASNGEDNEDGT